MSVTAFRIKNFMGFEDSEWIELRPITLLFGRNSTGKSAIIRALLLLRQSLRSKAEHGPLLFVDENGYDFGSFEDLVRDHDLDRRMTFGFRHTYQRPPEDRRKPPYRGTDEENIEAALSAMRVIDSLDDRKQLITETELTYEFNKEQRQAELCDLIVYDITTGKRILEATASNAGEKSYMSWDIISDFFEIISYDELPESEGIQEDTPIWPSMHLVPGYGFLPNLVTPEGDVLIYADTTISDDDSFAYEQLTTYDAFKHYLSVSFRHIRQFLTLSHLGPIRPEPQRFYYASGYSTNAYSGEGLSFIRSYLDAQNNDIQEERLEALQEWLEFSFGVRFKVAALDKKERLFEVLITEVDNPNTSNIREVGFGVSQLLPILIQTAVSGGDIRLLIEQPELHLHPSAQAMMGDLFIQTAKRGVCFLIETHSENLLLRFRRRIAETTASINTSASLELRDFAAYFVDRENGKSSIECLQFDEWGDYVKRPQRFGDFFGQDFEELTKMKKARLGGEKR